MTTISQDPCPAPAGSDVTITIEPPAGTTYPQTITATVDPSGAQTTHTMHSDADDSFTVTLPDTANGGTVESQLCKDFPIAVTPKQP